MTTLFRIGSALLLTLASFQIFSQEASADEAAIHTLLDRIEPIFAAGDLEAASAP